MKAILIIDEMPECCADCPCSFFERGTPNLNLICGPTQEDVNNIGKPDWCPLKEFPEKKNSEHTESYNDGWCDGWNSLRNKLEG